jgi:hypothetical protein
MSLFKNIANILDQVTGATRRTPKVIIKKTQPKANNEPINYLVHDTTTPTLMTSVNPPTPPTKPVFSVNHYAGGGKPTGSVEGQAANCFVTIVETINGVNQFTDKPLVKWGRSPTLTVYPRAGEDLNAYYDGQHLKFFYYPVPNLGTVFACDSTEIVSHELGHAILDSYRPDAWSAAALEVWAFHESFGDMTAILHSLGNQTILNYLMEKTGGNLHQSNIVANLAENFGKAIYTLAGPNSGYSPNYLRTALNTFKYVDPSTLPENAPDNQLAAEAHNFSRIFTGAFYDILVMIYEDAKAHGQAPMDAIKTARNTTARYLLKTIQNAPLNAKFYQSVATTMLWSDVTLGNRKYHDRMQAIFFDRNILVPQVKMLSAGICPNNEKIVHVKHKMHLKLNDHVVRSMSAHPHNPLYDVEVEVPHEHVYLYDNNRNLYDSIIDSEDEAVAGAQAMVDHLNAMKAVSDAPNTPFEVRDGKLVRSHFVCRCC